MFNKIILSLTTSFLMINALAASEESSITEIATVKNISRKEKYGNFEKIATNPQDLVFMEILSYLESITDLNNFARGILRQDYLSLSFYDENRKNALLRQIPGEYHEIINNFLNGPHIQQPKDVKFYSSSLTYLSQNIEKFTPEVMNQYLSTNISTQKIIAMSYQPYSKLNEMKNAITLATLKNAQNDYAPVEKVREWMEKYKRIGGISQEISKQDAVKLAKAFDSLPPNQFDDYLFAQEAFIYKQENINRINLWDLFTRIPYDILNEDMSLILAFNLDLLSKYFGSFSKDTTPEDIKSEWALLSSFFITENPEENTKILRSVSQIASTSRRLFLENAAPLKDHTNPLSQYRGYVFNAFKGVSPDDLNEYINAAHTMLFIKNHNFNEDAYPEIINKLSLVKKEHLSSIVPVFVDYYHTNQDDLYNYTYLIDSLRGLKEDPLKTTSFKKYIKNWNKMTDVVMADSQRECEDPQFDSGRRIQILKDLANVPDDKLNTIVQFSKQFIQNNPGLYINQNIISTLNQAPIGFLDKYLNAFYELKKEGFPLEDDISTNLLHLLTTTPHKYLEQLVQELIHIKTQNPNACLGTLYVKGKEKVEGYEKEDTQYKTHMFNAFHGDLVRSNETKAINNLRNKILDILNNVSKELNEKYMVINIDICGKEREKLNELFNQIKSTPKDKIEPLIEKYKHEMIHLQQENLNRLQNLYAEMQEAQNPKK